MKDAEKMAAETEKTQGDLRTASSRRSPLRVIATVLAAALLLGGVIVWRLHVNAVAAKALAQNGGGGRGAGAAGRGPTSVAAAPVTVRDIVHIFSTSANIESPETVKVSPRVAEQITAIPVKEGDPVHRGQVIIQLDDTQLAAAVRKEQALLAEGQAKLLQAQVSTVSVLTPIQTLIRQNKAAAKSAQFNYREVRQADAQQIAAADAAVADAQSKVASAKASIANAQAGLTSAQANETNDNTALGRELSLLKQGAVAQQDVDNARTVASVQTANVGVAQAQIGVAQAGLVSSQDELKSAQEQDAIARAKLPSDVEAARSTVVSTQSSLKNANANTVQQAAYQANIAGLQADVQSTQADLVTAQAQLAETVVRSPIDGFVSSRLADPGTLASPGTPILQLQALNVVWVNLPVPQEQIGEIQTGQGASVTVDNLPGRSFTGRVFEIDPSADPSSRDFTIRLSLSNPDALLKPGMYAHVSLVTQHVRQARTVPLEALQTDSDGAFVWLLAADSTVHRTPVTTGARDDNGVQILSGLHPGDKVVTVNAARLKDGDTVVLGGVGGAKGAGGKGGHHHKHSS